MRKPKCPVCKAIMVFTDKGLVCPLCAKDKLVVLRARNHGAYEVLFCKNYICPFGKYVNPKQVILMQQQGVVMQVEY